LSFANAPELKQILEEIATEPARGEDPGPGSFAEAVLIPMEDVVGMLWFEGQLPHIEAPRSR